MENQIERQPVSMENQLEYQPLLPAGQALKEQALEVRLGFVRKVYGILLVMLLLTFLIAFLLCLAGSGFSVNNAGLNLLGVPLFFVTHTWLIFVGLALVLAVACTLLCRPHVARRYPTNYVLIFLYAVGMGIIVGMTSVLFTWQTLLLTTFATTLIVLGLTAYACFAGQEFFSYGPYLLTALLLLMVFGNVLVFASLAGAQVDGLYMLYSFLMAVVFCFFLVMDTQLILGEAGGHRHKFSIDDYAFASLVLYSDIINLFLMLLNTLGSRDGGRR